MKKYTMVILGMMLILLVSFYIYYGHINILSLERKYIETKRTKSPDGQKEAVLVESDTGATSSLFYEVYIVEEGRKITTKDKPVMSADLLTGADLVWTDNTSLTIKFNDAKIYKSEDTIELPQNCIIKIDKKKT